MSAATKKLSTVAACHTPGLWRVRLSANFLPSDVPLTDFDNYQSVIVENMDKIVFWLMILSIVLCSVESFAKTL